jgi:hypothetical protein
MLRPSRGIQQGVRECCVARWRRNSHLWDQRLQQVSTAPPRVRRVATSTCT